MKHIIIRKPKFMRNDELMHEWIKIAQNIQKQIKESDTTESQYIDLWNGWWHCIHNAAKAGGFFSKDSFMRWTARENIKLM